MSIDYFYSLTPRQFFNIHKGWSDKREAESNERLVLTRKLMYASLVPWSKNLKEQDIWKFDFENPANIEHTEAERQLQEEQLEATRNYWDDIDNRLEKKQLN